MDVRYFREHADLDKTGDAEPDILGEVPYPPPINCQGTNKESKQQWDWLEEQIAEANSSASLILIGSGTQVLTDDKPMQEKFSGYPRTHRRLLNLLKKVTKQVIFLSGDVHYAQMLKRLPLCSDLEGIPLPSSLLLMFLILGIRISTSASTL